MKFKIITVEVSSKTLLILSSALFGEGITTTITGFILSHIQWTYGILAAIGYTSIFLGTLGIVKFLSKIEEETQKYRNKL
jgi:hypothetical protein